MTKYRVTRVQRLKRSSKPKPLPFTDAQIRDRAYALWQAQPERSAEDHWQAAIEALQRERSLPWKVQRLLRLAFIAETPSAALDVVKVVLSGFGVLATIFAGVSLLLTYYNSQEQLKSAQQERQLNSDRLVTDRFAKAIEQLGSKEIDVRIGAIYSLEWIAKDSPKYHWTNMEVLMAFVRNKSSLENEKTKSLMTDVQSVLTAIRRRNEENDNGHFDLSSAHLSNANLEGANLEGANLSMSDLREAKLSGVNLFRSDLRKANLSGVDLFRSDLREAKLSDANLSGANLIGVKISDANLSGASLGNTNLRYVNLSNVNLNSANLSRANLEGAYLSFARLSSANLSGANLEGADLKDALGLTTARVKTAKNWQKAHYDSDFRKQLGLPHEKPSP